MFVLGKGAYGIVWKAIDKKTTALAKKIGDSVKKDIDQQMAYYASLDQRRSDGLYVEIQYATRLQSMLQQMEQFLNPANAEKPAEIQTK